MVISSTRLFVVFVWFIPFCCLWNVITSYSIHYTKLYEFAYLIAIVLDQFLPTAVTLGAVMLAFGVSAAVGIIFGVYPARKAIV